MNTAHIGNLRTPRPRPDIHTATRCLSTSLAPPATNFGHNLAVPSPIRSTTTPAYRRAMTINNSKSPLAALSGLLCFIFIAGGISGLLHEWFGWIRFMGFVRFLIPHGYETYGYIVMIVLGLAVGIAGDAITRRADR